MIRVLTDKEYKELKKVHSIKANELTKIEEVLSAYERYTNENYKDIYHTGTVEGRVARDSFISAFNEYNKQKKILEEEEANG